MHEIDFDPYKGIMTFCYLESNLIKHINQVGENENVKMDKICSISSLVCIKCKSLLVSKHTNLIQIKTA